MTVSEFAQVSDARQSLPVIHQLQVRDVIRETADAISLVFDVPAGAEGGFRYKPGQFLTLKIPSVQTGSVSRCYSLSSSPHSDAFPTVTVKRTADGFASNWLCDNAIVGMSIECLSPAGAFIPKNWDSDFVLLAAGSGITPMMSIIKTALAGHSNALTLIYANRDRESAIFTQQLADIEGRYPNRFSVYNWLESESGLPTAPGLSALVSDLSNRDAFLCGPGPFMQIAEEFLLESHVPGERIHREVFRSLSSNPFEVDADRASADPFPSPSAGDDGSAAGTVELEGERHSFSWPRESVLLDVLLGMGLDAPYVCREGSCGGCACTITNGEVRMLANDTLDDHELGRGVRLACQSVPVSDDVEVVFD